MAALRIFRDAFRSREALRSAYDETTELKLRDRLTAHWQVAEARPRPACRWG